MDRSEALSERNTAGPALSIYEVDNARASKAESASRLARALTGFVLGAACWMAIAQFGVPNIIGIGTTGGEIPLGILGGVVAQTRLYRFLLWTTVALLLLLGVISFTNIVAKPARSLVRIDPIPRDADAVVVLSGGVTNDGFMPQHGSDRLRKGLELMKGHVAPVLVVTRERAGSEGRAVTSARDQNGFIALAGVDSVVRTNWVTSTREEAELVKAIALTKGWRRIVVVTSPFHSRRACATFEKVGLTVSCIPADSRDVSMIRMSSPHDRVGAFALWLYELAGTMRYRQLGYL